MRRAADFAFLDWPGPIAFAHRGDCASAPENTMAAFEAAVSASAIWKPMAAPPAMESSSSSTTSAWIA
jgi:hypothetical protein